MSDIKLSVPHDDAVIEQTIQEAIKSRKAVGSYMRPGMKIGPDAPKLALAIPIGDKDDPDLFIDPKTGDRFFAHVINPKTKKPFDAVKKVRVGGMSSAEFWLSLWQTVPPLLCSMQMMVRKGVLSAQARQEMTHAAIKGNCKYIFYLDDDVLVPPKAFLDLHAMMERYPDYGCISAVYVTREECPEPIVYKHHGHGGYWEFDPYTPGNVEEIFGAGAGLMIARTECLLDVKRIHGGPWWADELDVEGVESGQGKIMWGHDIRFCRRIWGTWQVMQKGFKAPGPAGVMRQFTSAEDVPKRLWKVGLAGWIQAGHWDVQKQKNYTYPTDAPNMKNRNNKHYWDFVWKNEGGRDYPELYSHFAKMVPMNSAVVDYGCGPGVLMKRLQEKRKCAVYGVDISERAIRDLKAQGMNGMVADAKKFKATKAAPMPEQTILVCAETIEHMDDEQLNAFFMEARKFRYCVFSTPEGDLPGTPPGEHVQLWKDKKQLESRLGQFFKHVRVNRLKTSARPRNPYLIAVCSQKLTYQDVGDLLRKKRKSDGRQKGTPVVPNK